MTHSASRAKSGTIAGTTFTFALMAVAVRSIGKLRKALKNRSQITQLHQLDDRALKDIGLLRSDVHEALSMSLLRDPSKHLIDVAGEFRGGSKPATGASIPDMNRLRRPDAAVNPAVPAGCVSA